MDDTISRQAAIEALTDIGVEEAVIRIELLPPAEPSTGKWVYQTGMIKCDQCLRAIRSIDHDGLLNFCPNCGADMREVTT